jgi:hypothetical protein
LRVLYAVICEHAEAREDGRLNVHGVFHHLFAPGFPAQQDHLVFTMALEWEDAEAGRQEFSIDLMDPTESPVFTIRGHTDVTRRQPLQPPPRTLFVFPLPDVRFPVEGTYFFVLDAAGGSHAVAPLHLIEDPEVG